MPQSLIYLPLVFEGKAMIVGMTRNICVKLYNEIVALKPEWHNDDLDKGAIKVIMTSTSDDPELFQPHQTTKQQSSTYLARRAPLARVRCGSI